MKLDLARFARSLVSSVRPEILLPMAPRPIRWCVKGPTFMSVMTFLRHSRWQTSMFVPDPVISLAIKPIGTETPNFSRALNRFQKEDPTFRVHVDRESKEVPFFRPPPPFLFF